MSDEQQAQLRMVGDSAADFAAAARRVHEGAAAHDMQGGAATWRLMAELGWFGIAVDEAQGGLGLGAPALCRVAQEAGRQLMGPPLTMGMATAAVLAQGDLADAAVAQALSGLLAGEQQWAMADVSAAGTLSGPYSLTGQPAAGSLSAWLVPDSDSATGFVLAGGAANDFEARLVPAYAPGVARHDHVAVDGSRLTDVHVSPAAWAAAPRVLQGDAGHAAWQQGRQLLWLGDAAYLSGLMDAALKLALDYLRLRKQFGVPIGSFQALQHRAATCHVDAQATQALVTEAAAAFATPRGAWAAAASMHRAAAAALRITKEVVQFHGAIGFADEHDAGLYLRRAMVLSARHARDVRTQLAQQPLAQQLLAAA